NDTLKYQVVLYLKENENYDKSLNIIEKHLENHKDEASVYKFGWQKFRIFYESGKVKEALSYLEDLSENLSGSKKDRAIFFLGIINFEENNFERSEAFFRDIVFSRPESKYFMLALYKLGLQYIYTGQEMLMYSLWSEYIYSFDLVPWKYYYGRTVFSTMRQLFIYKDKCLGFYNFSSPKAALCEQTDDENYDGIGETYFSYYDIAYAHKIDGCMNKKRKIRGMNKEHIELWEKNIIKYRDDYVGKIRENIQKIPFAVRSEEPFVMINRFNEAGLFSGMTFYARYIADLNRYNKQSDSEVPDILASFIDNPDASDRADSLWSNAVRYLLRDIYLLTGQYAKAINIHYNNVRKDLTFSPCKGLRKDWSFLYPTPYWETVKKLSIQFDISPALMYSIMRAETFFRKELVSPVGALGLMQVMPYTFEKISVRSGIKIENPLDPYDSMRAAAWYLNKLIMRFNGNIMLAAAAYNAGPHRVSKWLKNFQNVDAVLFSELIPFGETRRYVKKVLRYYEIYSYLYEGSFYDIQLKEKISTDENSKYVDF
ncbi:MAG: lytic transglycosylase domain-containing protein, partial [bacterium]